MPGLYDDILDAEAAGAGANPGRAASPYDTILDAEVTERRARLSASLNTAIDANPDKAAQQRTLARQAGIPVPTVERNEDFVARQQRLRDLQAAAAQSPVLAAQLSSPEFAKLAHDDVESLGGIENAIGRAAAFVMGADGRGGLPGLLGRGAKSLAAGALLESNAGLWGAAAAPLEMLGADSAGAWMRRQQQGLNARAKAWKAQPEDAGLVERGFMSGLSSAGQSLALLPLGLVGGEAWMLGTMGATTYGQTYGKGRDAGLSPGQAGVYAAEDATAEVVTEKFFGAAGLLSRIKAGSSAGKLLGYEVMKEVPGEIGATLWQNLNEWGNLNPDKSLRDWALEQPEAIGETIIATLVGGGAQIGAVKAIERVVLGREEQARRAQRAEQQTEALRVLSDLAAASKLRQRAPDVFQQFVAQLAEDGQAPQDVFISAETLAQSGLATQVAAVSPAVAEQLETALATGGDVRIPVDEFAAQVAGNGYAQQLLDHIKADPNGMTIGEARALSEAESSRFAEDVDRAAQEHAAEVNLATQGRAIEQGFAAQLDAAGRFSPAVNQVYAQLPRAFFETMAQRLGITPQELFQRYPLRLTAERILSERQALEQRDRDQTHVAITGAEFGAADLPVKELRQAARTWYDANLRDTPVTNRGSGREVLFGRAGKAFATAANAEKVRLFAALPALIESGQILSTTPPADPAKESNVKAYHWLEGNVQLGGRVVRVGVTLREDNRGNLYYNHNPIDGMKPPSSAELGDTAHKAGAGTEEAGAYEQSLSPDDINLYVLGQGARATFSPGSWTIALLKGADLSSFLHEGGHFFLEATFDMAARLDGAQREGAGLSGGELQVLADANALLKWFGIESLADWYGMDFEKRRAHHEQFAEGFEHHLFSGQAPSLELQPVFQRFRAWLLSVYESLKAFLERHPAAGKLSDEVRGVMDRMLATEQQIHEAQRARGLAPLFATADQAAAFGVEWSGYQALGSDATADATGALERRSVRDMTWTARLREKTISRLNRDAVDKRKEVRKEVLAEVRQQPVYAAIRFLAHGELADQDLSNGERKRLEAIAGMSTKLDLGALKEMYGEGPAAPWRYLSTGKAGLAAAKDGLHPDMAAEILGFDSGDQLVREILAAEPEGQLVDALTDQRMLERYGDLASPEALAKAADEAIHNDVRVRFLATELAALQQAMGGARALAQMAKEFGARLVEKAPVSKLRPAQYAAAAARASKAAEAALKKGDRQEAVRQKRFQLINHAATRAAYDAQAELQKTTAFFRRVAASASAETTAKGRNMDIVHAARAILAEHGVGMRGKDPGAYLEAVKAYDADLYGVLEPMLLEARQNARPLEQLSVGEVRALRDTVESLWHLARRERQSEIDGQLVDRDEVAEALLTRLEELGTPGSSPGDASAITPAEQRALNLASAVALARRVESWVDAKDGSNKMGVFRRYLFTPIKEAADRYRADKAVHLRKLRDAVAAIAPSMTRGRIAAPELNYTFGRDSAGVAMNEVLHALLHTGNASNKRKLLLGRGWATELPDGSLDTSRWDAFIARMVAEGKLTQTHYDFAQTVWDLLEEMKPLAQKAHRDAYGRYFAEVTADPFDTPFGRYRGGYVPATVDSRIVKDQDLKKLLEEGKDGMAYAFPSTAKGFTMSRVEYNRPLLLDLRTLAQHIDKVLLFSHLEVPVRDAARLLATKKVSSALNKKDPAAISIMLMPWLNRTARQQVTTPVAGAGWLMRVLNTLRNRAGMALMMGNLSNTAQQLVGFPAALKARPRHLLASAADWWRNPRGMAQEVAEMSLFMANRMDDQVSAMLGEVEEILLSPTLYERAQEWTKRHAYFLQSAVDNVLGPIVWKAAFNEALAENFDVKDAVRIADAAVRQTQGSTLPEDVSRIETGPAYARMFTQFMGWSNMLANLLGTEFVKVMQEMGLRKGMGRILYICFMGFYATAVVTEAVAQAFRGGPDDEDKDGQYLDDWLMALLVYGPLRTAMGFVPFVGPVVNSAVARFNSNPTDDRVSVAPVVGMVEGAAGTPADLYKAAVAEGNAQRTVRDVATLITITTGLPASVAARPAGYLAGVAQGRIEPTGPVDAARGLLTGVASPDSKQ